jgi:hypothetical protein
MDKFVITKPKPFCFILMPFDDSFDDIYNLGIKESCNEVGSYCERVDEQIFHETILDRIYNQISKADIVIADMTGRNPNVFYEVGYAHALGKPTILLTQKADDIPFDLKHYTHIVYNNKIGILKNELKKRVEYLIKNPINSTKNNQIDFELFLGNKNLTSEDVIYEIPIGHYASPEITIYNQSPYTFEPNNFKIGVITDSFFSYSTVKRISTIINNLPDGNKMHMIPYFDDIFFPNSYLSFKITLQWHLKIDFSEKDIIIRIFTIAGSRDYKLKMINNKN